jgi:hypothetical protein
MDISAAHDGQATRFSKAPRSEGDHRSQPSPQRRAVASSGPTCRLQVMSLARKHTPHRNSDELCATDSTLAPVGMARLLLRTPLMLCHDLGAGLMQAFGNDWLTPATRAFDDSNSWPLRIAELDSVLAGPGQRQMATAPIRKNKNPPPGSLVSL